MEQPNTSPPAPPRRPTMLDGIMRGRIQKPPKIIIYGPEGIGKSTFAAQAWNPIFIQTEDGLSNIECARFPICKTFSDVTSQLDTLIHEQHDFGTVAIDSLDWLQKLIHDNFKNRRGILIAKTDFQVGYQEAFDVEWRQIIAKLDVLADKMAVILIAHSEITQYANATSASFSRHVPKLHKTINAHLVEWADDVLFATHNLNVETEKIGANKTRGIAQVITGGADDDGRILICSGGPSVVAKNRRGIKGSLPLSWAAFRDAAGLPH
jgi:hypothetical protein